jgi:hypothetical protein
MNGIHVVIAIAEAVMTIAIEGIAIATYFFY